MASKTADGYGVFHIGKAADGTRRMVRAHRFAFGLAFLDGLEIDHLCQRTLCQRRSHMEAVTGLEHRRRRRVQQTHCRRGHHPLSGDNLHIPPDGKRDCRACNRDAHHRYRQAKRRNRPTLTAVRVGT